MVDEHRGTGDASGESKDEHLRVRLSNLADYRKRKGLGAAKPSIGQSWMPLAIAGVAVIGIVLGLGSSVFGSRDRG